MRHKTVLMPTTIAIIPSCPYGCCVPVIKSIKIIVTCPSKGTEDNETAEQFQPSPSLSLHLKLDSNLELRLPASQRMRELCARKTKFYSNSILPLSSLKVVLGPGIGFQAAAAFGSHFYNAKCDFYDPIQVDAAAFRGWGGLSCFSIVTAELIANSLHEDGTRTLRELCTSQENLHIWHMYS